MGLWVECCVGGFGLVWYEIVFVEVGNKLCEVFLCVFFEEVECWCCDDEGGVVCVGVDA